MISKLGAMLDELDLHDPTTDVILTAYARAEMQRTESVYGPLQHQHPSLQYLLDEMRNGKNPLQHLRETKEQITVAKSMSGHVALLPDTDNDKLRLLKRTFAGIGGLVDLYDAFIPVCEQACLGMVRAAKDVAATAGMMPEDVFNVDEYRAEVFKKAFPTRRELEQFYDISQRMGENMFSVMRGIITFAEQTGTVDACVQKCINQFPTTEAVNAMYGALRSYQARDVDEIYSTGDGRKV
jgi:hypothetical protein